MPSLSKKLKVIFHWNVFRSFVLIVRVLPRFAAIDAIELPSLEDAIRYITLFLPSVNTSRTLNGNSVITK